MSSSNRILLIQTGGTIDKDYPHVTNGWAFEISDSAADEIFASIVKPRGFDYEFVSVCTKDSLEIDEDDRAEIVAVIEDHPDIHKVIITHGTDTIIETAKCGYSKECLFAVCL